MYETLTYFFPEKKKSVPSARHNRGEDQGERSAAKCGEDHGEVREDHGERSAAKCGEDHGERSAAKCGEKPTRRVRITV